MPRTGKVSLSMWLLYHGSCEKRGSRSETDSGTDHRSHGCGIIDVGKAGIISRNCHALPGPGLWLRLRVAQGFLDGGGRSARGIHHGLAEARTIATAGSFSRMVQADRAERVPSAHARQAIAVRGTRTRSQYGIEESRSRPIRPSSASRTA